MAHIRNIEQNAAAIVGYGVRVLLITGTADDAGISRKLGGLGSIIEMCDELYAGLEAVIDDPLAYGLVVIDCDLLGGIAAGQRAHALLKVTQRDIPMILISSDCTIQEFPASRHEPTVLRAPLSSISLRVGFEHALRERLLAQRVH